MAKKIDPILKMLLAGDIDIDEARRIVESKSETRGRNKKLVTECPEFLRAKDNFNKARSRWIMRAVWLRLEFYNITYIDKLKIMNQLDLHIGFKAIENEISISNKLKALDDFVIKVGINSVVFSTERDVDIAKFGNVLGIDPMSHYFRLESGFKAPALLESIGSPLVPVTVFVEKSIFFGFRKQDLAL